MRQVQFSNRQSEGSLSSLLHLFSWGLDLPLSGSNPSMTKDHPHPKPIDTRFPTADRDLLKAGYTDPLTREGMINSLRRTKKKESAAGNYNHWIQHVSSGFDARMQKYNKMALADRAKVANPKVDRAKKVVPLITREQLRQAASLMKGMERSKKTKRAAAEEFLRARTDSELEQLLLKYRLPAKLFAQDGHTGPKLLSTKGKGQL